MSDTERNPTSRAPADAVDRVGDPSLADPAPDLAEILRKAETEVADLKDAWLRAKAETENVRRAGRTDLARAHKYATERFASELLPVRDALEQALSTPNATPEQVREGVELTLLLLRQPHVIGVQEGDVPGRARADAVVQRRDHA